MLTREELSKLTPGERAEYLKMGKHEKEIYEEIYRQSENDSTSSTEKNNEAPKEEASKSVEEIRDSGNNGGGGSDAKKGREYKDGVPVGSGRHKSGCPCEKCAATRARNAEKKANKVAEVSEKVIASDTGPFENGESNKEKINAETTTAEEQLEKELGQYKEVETSDAVTQEERGPGQSGPSLNIGQFINGALFLVAMDYAFPFIIKIAFGFFSPKFSRLNERGIEKMQLSGREKELLEPSADAVVSYIFKDANPIAVFFITAGVMYFGKAQTLTADCFDAPKLKVEKTGKDGRRN